MHTTPCRRPPLAVSWPSSRPCRWRALPYHRTHAGAGSLCRSLPTFAPGHDTKLYCDTSPCRALHRAPTPGRRALGTVSQPCCALCSDTRPPPSHNIMFVSRLPYHPSRVRSLSHALTFWPVVSLPLLAVSQGRVPTLPRRVVARPCGPAARPCVALRAPAWPYAPLHALARLLRALARLLLA